jgi:hypothetical protein
MTVPKFYFDGNEWCGVVDSSVRWFDLLASYPADEGLVSVLDAKMAPSLEVQELPRNYFLGATPVHDGTIPSFGFRCEHLSGNVRLEDWAKNRGCDLRALAAKRNLA